MAEKISLGTKIMGVITDGIPEIPGYIAEIQLENHYIMDKYGIDGTWFVWNVPGDKLGDFITAAKVLKMPGFGVTMPHKSAIVPYLDHVEDTAKACEAVNLVIIRDGETYGYMTDGTGYCAAWDEKGVDLTGRHVTFLGAGAIVPIIAYELSERGVKDFTILNRSPERANKTADIIRRTTGKDVEVLAMTNESLDEAASRTDLLIQCTPLGMVTGTDEDRDWEYLGFVDRLPEGCLVSDVLLETEDTGFLAKAKEKGFMTSNGIDMEVNQMPETFARLFPEVEFGDDLVEIARTAYEKKM